MKNASTAAALVALIHTLGLGQNPTVIKHHPTPNPRSGRQLPKNFKEKKKKRARLAKESRKRNRKAA
jgi:hypothetical protein